MAALSGWGSIRRFLGVPLPRSLPLRRTTTSRMYEEKRHARYQLQAQNGTTIGIDSESVDNTLAVNGPHCALPAVRAGSLLLLQLCTTLPCEHGDFSSKPRWQVRGWSA